MSFFSPTATSMTVLTCFLAYVTCEARVAGYRCQVHAIAVWVVLMTGAPLVAGHSKALAAIAMLGMLTVMLQCPQVAKLCEERLETTFALKSRADPFTTQRRIPIPAVQTLYPIVHAVIHGCALLAGVHPKFNLSVLITTWLIGLVAILVHFSRYGLAKKLCYSWAILIAFCTVMDIGTGPRCHEIVQLVCMDTLGHLGQSAREST